MSDPAYQSRWFHLGLLELLALLLIVGIAAGIIVPALMRSENSPPRTGQTAPSPYYQGENMRFDPMGPTYRLKQPTPASSARDSD